MGSKRSSHIKCALDREMQKKRKKVHPISKSCIVDFPCLKTRQIQLLHLPIWCKFHRDTVTESAVRIKSDLCCYTTLLYVVTVHHDLLSLTCISCLSTKICHVFCKLFINVIMMMEWSHFAKIFRCNGFRGY